MLATFYQCNCLHEILYQQMKTIKGNSRKQNPKGWSRICPGLRIQGPTGEASHGVIHPCLVWFLVCVQSKILCSLALIFQCCSGEWLSILTAPQNHLGLFPQKPNEQALLLTNKSWSLEIRSRYQLPKLSCWASTALEEILQTVPWCSRVIS